MILKYIFRNKFLYNVIIYYYIILILLYEVVILVKYHISKLKRGFCVTKHRVIYYAKFH